MNCPNCNQEMTSETITGQLVKAVHTCASCGAQHNVTFANGNGYNPFAALRDINPSVSPRIFMASRCFAMQSSDWYFAKETRDCTFLRWNEETQAHESYTERKEVGMDNLATEKTVIYTDLSTNKVYEWQAIAYLENGTIQRFLYLNGELHNHTSWIHHRVNNPLNRWLTEPKEAVLSALNHAEKVTKEMAMGEWAL